MRVCVIGTAMLAASLVSFGLSTAIAAEPTMTVNVDCNRGESIAKALSLGEARKPLLVVVRGTCNEAVSISSDDVTLRGESGGAINGPDPAVTTLTVSANRVTIEDLSVSGGRNGITGLGASQLTVRGTTVQSTGRNGIVYSSGSNGTIDNCTIQSNPRDGIGVDAATATILNSTIRNNARIGILVSVGGVGRIGVDIRNEAGGNTIEQNGANGIVVSTGGYALIAMNTITGNGTDPAQAGRQGISVIEGRADLAGGNTISGHAVQGLFTRASSVQIGGPALPGISTVNTFSNNGFPMGFGGIFASLGSSLTIRDAVITNNTGFGLGFSLRSQGQIFSSTIQANSGDGIRLVLGSALLPSTPTTTVSGSSGFGIQCFDAESSVVNTSLPAISFSGNSSGDVSPFCTPF